MRKIPELLSPAGSKESLIAAVEAGADAVYLGGPLFNARRSAENFTIPIIEEAVAYAHLHGVRVYATLNTLIYEREIDIVTQYLLSLYSSGIDAILIQDTGLLRRAREIVPQLPLHASTQAGIHNTAGVIWAAKNDFSRVVLARELECHEISEIIKKTENYGIGIEVFAHGALCCSYSGQCLFSSVIGGRSGNRGICAQPCRKPYTLVMGNRDKYGRYRDISAVPLQNQFLLSMKDLSLYPILDKVVETGVVAIKIEGRLRSPDYVRKVTSVYRKALDSIASGSFVPSSDDMEELLIAFNRGFTTGYIGKDNVVFSRERPDNRGIYLGNVIHWDKKKKIAEVNAFKKIQLKKGDGVVFQGISHDKDNHGFSLSLDPKYLGDKIFIESPFPVKTGLKVFLTHRHSDILEQDRYWGVKIPVSVILTIGPGGEILFEGSIKPGSGDLIPVQYRSFEKLEPARKAPLSRSTIIEHIKKEDSLFQIQDLTLIYDGGFFIPLSLLNKIRRDFFLFCKKRAANFNVERLTTPVDIKVPERLNPLPESQETVTKRYELSVTTDNPEGILAAAESGASIIYFGPGFLMKDEMTLTDAVKSAIRQGQMYNIPIVWVWPRITHNHDVRELCRALKEMGSLMPYAISIETIGLANMIHSHNPEIPLIAGPGLNVTNHLAIEECSKYFKHIILSYECSVSDVTEMLRALSETNQVGIEIIVQGNTPSLITRDKLPESLGIFPYSSNRIDRKESFLGLKDGRKRIFPIYKDFFSRSVILNSVENCLIDELDSIIKTRVTRIGIDARGRTPEYISLVTSLYREALESIGRNDNNQILARLCDRVRDISLGGITRGPFYAPLP